MTHLTLRFLIHTYSIFFETVRLLSMVVLSPTKLGRQWNIRDRAALPTRLGGSGARRVAWVHAASLGESRLLLRFLDILRKKHPGQAYILTATTRTGVDYLRGRAGGDVIAVGFMPFDTVRLMTSLLSSFSVSRVWLMETELWPAMLWSCMQNKIPLGLVNARIEERSLSSYLRLKWLLSPLFSYPDTILAQSAAYAERFGRLGIPAAHIRVTGNLKSAVTICPCAPDERRELRKAMSLSHGDLCITAGCLHPGEGAVMGAALAAMREKSLHVKCIVAPRHLKDAPALAKELGNGTIRLSEARAQGPWDICIVEKMGVLEPLYKIADAAIIGGTFDDTGGHNMWDAAQFGIPVLFGPNYATQTESAEKLIAAGVAFTAADANGLAHGIAMVLRDNAKQFQQAQERFMNEVNAKSHTLEELIP
jgi:3-deoxy-D-manno-octulosonic-acid transferase